MEICMRCKHPLKRHYDNSPGDGGTCIVIVDDCGDELKYYDHREGEPCSCEKFKGNSLIFNQSAKTWRF